MLPAVPRELVLQLNLFAGQLYLRTHEEYVEMCRFLGLACVANGGVVGAGDGFFVGRVGGEGYEGCEFETSPVGMLSVLVKNIRRDCVDIGRSHVGRIL